MQNLSTTARTESGSAPGAALANARAETAARIRVVRIRVMSLRTVGSYGVLGSNHVGRGHGVDRPHYRMTPGIATRDQAARRTKSWYGFRRWPIAHRPLKPPAVDLG